MKFSNLKLSTRLGGGFGLVLVLLMMTIAIGVQRFQEVGTTTARLVEDDWAKAGAASVVDTMTRANAARTLELFIAPDQAYRDGIYARIGANKQTIDKALSVLQRRETTVEGRSLLQKVTQQRVAYVQSFSRVSSLVKAGQHEEARRLVMAETLPRLEALQRDVQSLREFQERRAREAGTQAQRAVASGQFLLLAFGAAAVVLGLAFSVGLTRSIVGPLRKAVAVAQRVASGDLTSRIEPESSDELGELLQALKTMNGNLGKMVRDMRVGSETIATASTQITCGNDDLAARTEMQASSLQESAASMEQLTGAVQQNAASARQANELARSTGKITADGSDAVARVAATMNDISESARRIADITGMIDAIAFQTNILALNAAVEAARAGEQGKGFAVVATEVRNLAQRCAAAAREIKLLIEDSTTKIADGRVRTEQAAQIMRQVLSSVQDVTVIMAEITRASDEQRIGIEQVNQAVSEMDGVTQENAALVEEAGAAAQSLQEQARSLSLAIQMFKLAESSADSLAQGARRFVRAGKVRQLQAGC